jgi:hypothetical protein
VDPLRFETMPSKPSLQACSKTRAASSSSMCSLSSSPIAERRSSLASSALRTSIDTYEQLQLSSQSPFASIVRGSPKDIGHPHQVSECFGI